MRQTIALLAIGLLGFSATANAQINGSGTSIGGTATANVETGSQTALAVGYASEATNAAGVIADTHTGGSATANASVDSQTALALTAGARAKTLVGTISGVNTGGSARANGHAGSVLALSPLPGTSTCVAIGSVGPGGTNASGYAGRVIAYNFGIFSDPVVRIGTSGAVC